MGEVIPLVPRHRRVETEVDAESLYDLACSIEAESAQLAETTYQAALAVDPGHAGARVNLGRLLHEAGNLAAAVEHYRAALAADPGHATAAFNLGVALEDLGRRGEACAAYQRAILADPSCADAHFNLSGLLRKSEPRAALRHLVAYRRLIRD